ncbi:ABC transporter permease [Streptomyces sp. ID05-47C]|uniref:ABC transporter permease n=1 Tax=Streptomyces sp. ID05-47C TaxID=3028665 RepID=UPI0029B8D09D|nr:ABC transporter permease [Streptomyces sp. ID05-47C]MDX3574132.1 hypothetical protein [Streptomyces sp. ID05-47C]
MGGRMKYVFVFAFPFIMAMLLVGIYTSAMHSPTPKDLPVAVVGTSAQAKQMAAGLNKANGSPVDARVVASVERAKELLHDRDIVGAFVLPATAEGDAVIYTAQAAGAAQAEMVKAVLEPLASSQHLDVVEKDIAALPAHDGMGVTVMFTGIAWVLAGYIVVAAIGSGAPELNPLRRLVPLMAGWACLMSLVIWLLVGPVIGAVEGHSAAILGLGALSIFTVSMTQTMLSRFMGLLAVLPGITLFVFLGVPASGLSVSEYAVPGFFRFLHDVLPLPAAGETLRSVLYFDGSGAGGHLLVLAVWTVVALALTAVVDLRRHRSGSDSGSATGASTADFQVPEPAPAT